MPVRPFAQVTAKLVVLFCLLSAAASFAQRPLGVDVSNHQGNGIVWSSVKSAGYTFAWTKATQGTTFTDSDFALNEANAKAAGVYIGAYDFAAPASNTPTNESAFFWSVAKNYIANGGFYMMPMLDYEDFTGHTGATSHTDWANQWYSNIVSSAATKGVTVKPVLYVSACNGSYFNTAITKFTPWIADYNGENPQTGTPWSTCASGNWWGSGNTTTWTFWQYSSSGSVSGISGSCDVDVYQGTAATLSANIIGGGGPSITTQPASVTATAGTNVNFSVAASGTSLSYQWRFNQTNITGATASSYNIASIVPTNAGNYTVVVRNSSGSTTSDFAYLSISVTPTNAPDAILAPTQMVNWWDGQGDTSDTFGSNNGTPHGNFYYQPGYPGLAYHFDGSSTYLTTGAASLPVPWTLSLWVNRQNAPGSSAALLSDGSYSFKLEQYNGTRQVGISHFTYTDDSFGYVVPLNTWTHLAMVGTSTGTSLYINGVLQSSLTNSQPLPRKYIGVSFVTSGSVITDYLNATVDEIATFNRALSASEINAIYTAGANGFLRAPEWTSVTTSGTSVLLNVQGITGKTFSVYRSPDLLNWTFLNRVSSSTGTLQYFDTNNGSPAYFYKAAQP